MKSNTVSARMFSLVVLHDIHTTYFSNALDGISDKDAHNRLNTKANHVAWLAGSIVHQRFDLAKTLGVNKKQAADELFRDNKGIQDNVIYPPLADYRKDWEIISPLLRETLANVKDEKLDESFEMMPDMRITYYDLITFSTYREASIIGQIALWRRLLGYEAMKYM